jgi:hypothetical protein
VTYIQAIDQESHPMTQRVHRFVSSVFVALFLIACGDSIQVVPPAQGNEIGPKKVQAEEGGMLLVASEPPFQLFTYSKDKTETADDREHYKRFERYMPDKVKPVKIDIDPKA